MTSVLPKAISGAAAQNQGQRRAHAPLPFEQGGGSRQDVPALGRCGVVLGKVRERLVKQSASARTARRTGVGRTAG